VADRSTKVTLTAQVSGYIAGMQAAAQKTREVGTEAEKLAQQRQGFATLGAGVLAFGAVAAAGVGLAVAKFAEFDAQMSAVQAATNESAENMGKLRDAALEAGASTVYTATEAAQGIEELAKAGVETTDILNGGLKGALALASAGQLSVADAASDAAIAMQQFKLQGGDVPHVADLLAAGAGKAVGEVSDLSAALNQAGLVADGTGLSIEETTGTLAAFASAGLIGSDAGTSLKTALQRLTPQSAQAKEEMDRLGISAYDAQGNFIGISKFAGVLQSSLKNLTPEQRAASESIIFGSDAVRAANVLYDQGQAGIQGWIDQVNDSGYAARVAATKMDNLKGDVENLGGSFENVLIKSGSGANDVLRTLVQTANFLVNTIGAIPGPALAVGIGITAVAAAMALAAGAALVAVPRFAQMKLALDGMNISAKSAALGVGLIGGALGAATLVFGYFASKAAEAAQNTKELQDSLDQASGATTKYTRDLIAQKLAQAGAFDAAKAAGVSQKELTDAVLKGGDALDRIVGKIEGQNTVAGFFDGSAISAGNAVTAIDSLRGSVEGSKQAYEDTKAAADENTASTEDAATAYQDAATKAQDLNDNLTSLIDTVNRANGVGQDAVSANLAYQDALAKVDDTIQRARDGQDGYSLSLDTATQAGRDNLGMLNELAGRSQDAAEKQFALDHNTDAYIGTLQAGRDALVQRALDLGYNADQAQQLADKIYAIPDKAEVQVIADTAQATQDVADFRAALNTIDRNPVVRISTVTGALPSVARANGGPVYGPGTATSDSINARLSNGEYVVRASAVARNRLLLDAINYGSATPTFVPTASRYADGGLVRADAAGSNSVSYPVNYNAPVYVVDPEELARASQRRTQQAIARSGITRVGVA
jgi:TP901 family phage tail tape measure protein